MALDDTPPAATSTAVLDPQHVGDIVGALGTVKQDAQSTTRSKRKRLRMLLVVLGPGLIVMGGGNDAGGVQVYAQMGQDYGMKLLWSLVLLFPILYIAQEMVVRLGAVSGVGHARLIFDRFGKFWGAFSVIDLFIINAVTIVAEFIGVQQALEYFGWPDTLSIVSAAVLLFVAIVGTTVEPWQLFLQQASVVDKRITPRWIRMSRIDLGAGILIEAIGVVILMFATAFGLAHTSAFGNFTDLNTTAHDLTKYVGHGVGALMAIAMLDGSLIGANLVGLTTTYTLGDVFPKIRHSLHWKAKQAPIFYGIYAVLIGLGATVALTAGNTEIMGNIIDYVEALNGILLPSAMVFLILLANDKPVLGPWSNTPAQNILGGLIAWIVTTFSLAPLITTFYLDVTLTQCLVVLAAATLVGLVLGIMLWRYRPSCNLPITDAPEENRRPPGMDRSTWRTVLDERRIGWRTPRLDTLAKPTMSPARRAGVLTLRGYLILSVIVLVVKLTQVGLGS